MKNFVWILVFIYFLTRLPFLSTFPVYYDSFEYSRISKKINFNNFEETVIFSHQPFHTFYFLIIFVFKKLLFFLSPTKILTFISFVFGLLTVIVWYQLLRKKHNREQAFFSSLVLLIFPYFFAVNTNIFYESPLLFFQILSFYLLFLFYKNKKRLFLLLSGVSLGLSVSIFIGSLLIFPVYILALWKNRKENNLRYFLIFYIISVLTPILIDWLILKSPDLIYRKYLSHLFDVTSSSGGLMVFLFRIFRNSIVQFYTILSFPGIIFGLAAIFLLLKKKTVSILTLLILFLPFFISSQYWHAGLYSRISLYIIFPVSYLISLNFKSVRLKFIILFIGFPAIFKYMFVQLTAPPIYRYFDLYKNQGTGENTAVITSDYNRFVYEKENIAPLFIIKDAPGNTKNAENFIKNNLKEGRTVIIDSAGLKFPYFQFDGYFFHPYSKNYNNKGKIENILEKYSQDVWAKDKTDENIYFIRLTTGQADVRIKKLIAAL